MTGSCYQGIVIDSVRVAKNYARQTDKEISMQFDNVVVIRHMILPRKLKKKRLCVRILRWFLTEIYNEFKEELMLFISGSML